MGLGPQLKMKFLVLKIVTSYCLCAINAIKPFKLTRTLLEGDDIVKQEGLASKRRDA